MQWKRPMGMPARISFALAVVLTAATMACKPREEKNLAPVDAREEAEDKAVLEQLRSAGSDMTKPHKIEFYLYLASEADAEAVGRELRPMGYAVAVKPGVDGTNWLCLASRTMLPTIQGLSEARGVLTPLALRYRGAYDGWDAAIER